MGSAARTVGTSKDMTPEQARAAHLAYDHLYQYLCSGGGAPGPSDAELMELTFGNLLAAETLVGILARLRGKTFDQALDGLPERDEGYPPGRAGGILWDTSVYRLRFLHAHSWLVSTDRLPVYELPTAFRGSFNLVVSSVAEVAAETKTTARQLAGLLRDAAVAEMR